MSRDGSNQYNIILILRVLAYFNQQINTPNYTQSGRQNIEH